MKKIITITGFVLVLLGVFFYISMAFVVFGWNIFDNKSFGWLTNFNGNAFSYLPILSGFMIVAGAYLLKEYEKNN